MFSSPRVPQAVFSRYIIAVVQFHRPVFVSDEQAQIILDSTVYSTSKSFHPTGVKVTLNAQAPP